MFKKISITALSVIIAAVTLTGCGSTLQNDAADNPQLPVGGSIADNTGSGSGGSADDGGSGYGMTYGGKPGFDMGGIVIPFDGSSPSMGFGF